MDFLDRIVFNAYTLGRVVYLFFMHSIFVIRKKNDFLYCFELI